MLVGKKVILRTFRDADVDKLYDLAAGVRNMGEDLAGSSRLRIRFTTGHSFLRSAWMVCNLGCLPGQNEKKPTAIRRERDRIGKNVR